MQNCPVCKSSNIRIFMRGIFDSNDTNVMECENCGLQYLSPIMTEQEEEEYYEGYYRKQQDRHFKVIQLDELQERAFKHYEHYSEVYLNLISGCTSILEIGSGTGGFLRFVRQYRPETKLASIERCRENVDFMRQCFPEVRFEENLSRLSGTKFDCVVAFGVFEHLRNSEDFLSEVRSYIQTDGVLVLNVPNKTNALVYGYGLEEFKRFTYMKQHYFTFTESAFRLLADNTGYAIGGFNYMQVWGLDNHISWLRYRQPRDFRDITALLSENTLDSYSKDMIDRKMTDIFMAVLKPLPGDSNQPPSHHHEA
jgi:cyclopropane fatty-acyl-phospholipid synthase-like methyltransferase